MKDIELEPIIPPRMLDSIIIHILAIDVWSKEA